MININVYSLILATGASFGLFRIALASPRAQRVDWLLSGILTLLGSLIGARLSYVLEHIHFYTDNPSQIIQFWQGGLSWTGIVPIAFLLMFAASKIWEWPFPLLLDRMSLLVMPMGIAAWLGSWLTGTAYGSVLPVETWWGIRALDEAGQSVLRNPIQPMAALSLLVFLGFLELNLVRDKNPGWYGSLVFLVFSADMLLFTFLKADPSPIWLGLRIETWAGMVYTLAGILVLSWAILRKRGIKVKFKFKFDLGAIKRFFTKKVSE